MAVGSIQEKCWLTVVEGESGNSTVAEGGILVTGKSGRAVLKSDWDISWFKDPQGGVSLPNQSNLFLIL